MIYFDNSATTKPYPEALATYTEVASKIWGNPSSLHNLGSQATRILEASRKQIASLLGKKAEEIYFTSGGTEGDNWAIKGVAFEKAPMESISLSQLLSIQLLRNRPFGYKVKDLKWILLLLMRVALSK